MKNATSFAAILVAAILLISSFMGCQKDNQGNVLRVDVGDSEGHRMPFVVETIVEDGGTPWYVEFWRWITFQ